MSRWKLEGECPFSVNLCLGCGGQSVFAPQERGLLCIFHQENLRRKVVGVAIEPGASGCGALWCTLVFTFSLEEIVAREDRVGEQVQTRGLRLVEESGREYDLVEEIPLTSVVERADAFVVEHIPPRVI